jgi:hypothetical protein
VDTALVTLVLPRAEDAARDMGVLNIANAGPPSVRSAACADPHPLPTERRNSNEAQHPGVGQR